MSSGTPYTSGPHILEVDAPSNGDEECFQLRTPHRGRITAIKVEQIAGADTACDFELFSSRKACPHDGSSLSSESLSEALEGPRSAYSIFGTKQVVSGVAFGEYNSDYNFRNADGTSTNPQRYLYIALRPAATGAKQFSVTFEMTVSQVG